jgi:hypothetical protein
VDAGALCIGEVQCCQYRPAPLLAGDEADGRRISSSPPDRQGLATAGAPSSISPEAAASAEIRSSSVSPLRKARRAWTGDSADEALDTAVLQHQGGVPRVRARRSAGAHHGGLHERDMAGGQLGHPVKAHVFDPATGISLTRPEHSGRT